jgi:hypothetical protein
MRDRKEFEHDERLGELLRPVVVFAMDTELGYVRPIPGMDDERLWPGLKQWCEDAVAEALAERDAAVAAADDGHRERMTAEELAGLLTDSGHGNRLAVAQDLLDTLTASGFTVRQVMSDEQARRVTFAQSGHVELKHEQCDQTHCQFCDGGLFACTVCGALEGATPTHCPGKLMTGDQHDAVYEGRIDYRDDGWCPGPSPHSPTGMQRHAAELNAAKGQTS